MKLSKERFNLDPIAIGFILLSVLVVWVAMGFPDQGQIGPHFFPILLSLGLVFFSLLVIVRKQDKEQSEFDIDRDAIKSAVFVFALLAVYIVLMPYTGFLIGTTLFLLVTFRYSGVQSMLFNVVVSLFFTLFLFYLFADIFLVRLPEGVIPISTWLPSLPLWINSMGAL